MNVKSSIVPETLFLQLVNVKTLYFTYYLYRTKRQKNWRKREWNSIRRKRVLVRNNFFTLDKLWCLRTKLNYNIVNCKYCLLLLGHIPIFNGLLYMHSIMFLYISSLGKHCLHCRCTQDFVICSWEFILYSALFSKKDGDFIPLDIEHHTFLSKDLAISLFPLNTFIQCQPNIFDGPTLYGCYANVLCLLGLALMSSIIIFRVFFSTCVPGFYLQNLWHRYFS